MHIRKWQKLIILNCVFIALTVIAGPAVSKSKKINITSPSWFERIESLPVEVTVEWSARFDSSTATLKLNGQDVTGKFDVSEGGAHGFLDITDGLIPNRGKEGRKFASNFFSAKVKRINKRHYKTDRVIFKVRAPSIPRSVATIPASGGSVRLEGVATATFPDGAFENDQVVELAQTSTDETSEDFEESAFIFGANSRAPFEIRINTGTIAPIGDLQVEIPVPADYAATVGSESEFQVFAQILQSSEFDVLDSFELFESSFDATTNTITVTLPQEAFTDLRSSDGTFEAVIVLGTTPTAPEPISATQSALKMSSNVDLESSLQSEGINMGPDEVTSFSSNGKLAFGSVSTLLAVAGEESCEGSSLGAPLDELNEGSSFNGTNHYGTDYPVPDGSIVRAMADGVVENIATNIKNLQKPDPRSGLLVSGWGLYLVLKHTDGSKSLYAHLQSTSVSIGDTVTSGQQIALSNNSGGSTGPHLHVEYAPNGKIYQSASKVNPVPCIGGRVTGSITVSDNGSLADDAFSVSINGLQICQTQIGQLNTCSAGNLRPGTATLTITATIAPDNVGTYLIALGDGLTFTGGGSSQSGVIGQGQSATFTINIPDAVQ